MRFLFTGPGYPGAKGTVHGSGIGTYLHEITLGLAALGHECHVIAWGEQSGVRSQKSGVRSQEPNPQQLNNLTTQQLPVQDINGVKVFLLPHSYWPVIERIMPDSRDVWNMRRMVRQLDAEYHYDWVEIQSEEGIGIGVQRAFPEKTILRAHTTLLQMVKYKGDRSAAREASSTGSWQAAKAAKGNNSFNIDRQDTQDKGLWDSSCKSCTSMLTPSLSTIEDAKESYNIDRQDTQDKGLWDSSCKSCASMLTHSLSALQDWKLRYRLRRERRSFAIARRIVTHSKAHAEEIKKLYPGIVEPVVVHHGIGEARREKLLSCQVAKLSSESPEASSISALSNSTAKQLNNSPVPPTFLIIGTPDRRKGFDRIRPVLEAYAAKYGPCRCVIVGGKRGDSYWLMVNGGEGVNPKIAIEWKSGLSAEELGREFAGATVYLHLARYESFGIPLIEAASHGVPIVSTRVGVAPELLSGDLGDCLVDGDDIGAIAEALHRAVENRVLIGRQVYSRYAEGFARDRMTTTFLASLS